VCSPSRTFGCITRAVAGSRADSRQSIPNHSAPPRADPQNPYKIIISTNSFTKIQRRKSDIPYENETMYTRVWFPVIRYRSHDHHKSTVFQLRGCGNAKMQTAAKGAAWRRTGGGLMETRPFIRKSLAVLHLPRRSRQPAGSCAGGLSGLVRCPHGSRNPLDGQCARRGLNTRLASWPRGLMPLSIGRSPTGGQR
jgi:hypothetical protein